MEYSREAEGTAGPSDGAIEYIKAGGCDIPPSDETPTKAPAEPHRWVVWVAPIGVHYMWDPLYYDNYADALRVYKKFDGPNVMLSLIYHAK